MALIGTMKYLTIGNQTYEIAGDELQIASASTLGGIKVGSGLSIDSTTGVLSTSITETDPVFTASAAAGITATDISNWNGKTNTNISYDSSSRTLKKTVNGTTSDVVDFGTAAFKLYTTTVTSDGTGLPTSAAVASFVEGKGYITSYTETDPVYSASAAAGITATDISNWNAKSDVDEKVKLTSVTNGSEYPVLLGPTSITSGNTYSSNYNADITINPNSKQLTLKSLKIYYNGDSSATLASNGYNGTATNNTPVLKFVSAKANTSGGSDYCVQLNGVKTPTNTEATYDYFVANKKYVDDKVGSITIPTKTSDLTNDSGFITSFTDENVKSTTVTAATTYYLTGSTSSSTATGGLSKHAAIKAYVTANSGTGGSARIDLGNTTATTSAGGKEGIVRLYGTSATYYVDVKAGAPSANRTITLPNKTGTVALTSDIPTVPTITLNGTSTTTPSFYAPTTAGTNGYFLKSNGSGAPTWAEIETTAAQIVRW